MAKAFYYDSVGLLESTTTDGSVVDSDSDNLFEFSASSTLINEHFIIDQNITNAVTGWAKHEGISFNLGSSKPVDFLALFFNVDEGDNLVFEHDTAATGESTARVLTVTETITANNWLIKEFSEVSKQYWRIFAVSTGGLVGFTEVLFGKKLQFEINPDLGISESEKFGTDLTESLGGVQFALKRHQPIKTITLTFSSISNTFKTSLQSMQDEVQNFKKFIFSEDGTTGPLHYVRLGKPIDFKEVSVNRFSCTISLVEQLS
tara:strand:- start:1113 stop:1895 length:783 start_codon:yes stop_codon:yes gene_type:complete